MARHVSSIAELPKTVATWKAKYAAKSSDSTAQTGTVPAVPSLSKEELHALDAIEGVSGDTIDAMVSMNMRETLLKAQQASGPKITTNR